MSSSDITFCVFIVMVGAYCIAKLIWPPVDEIECDCLNEMVAEVVDLEPEEDTAVTRDYCQGFNEAKIRFIKLIKERS